MGNMENQQFNRKHQVLQAYFEKEAGKFAAADTPLMREAHLLQVDAILDEYNEFVRGIGGTAVQGAES